MEDLETTLPVSAATAPAGPCIENPHGLPLPEDAERIFQAMFAGYRRLVIHRELGGGYSGSRVFLVRPVRPDGAPELPAVVKLAPAGLIQREWMAYHACIRERLPGVAEIRGDPVLPGGAEPGSTANSIWGGLRYPLVGGGAFEVDSLYDFCRCASTEEIGYVLVERLFRAMGPMWRFSRAQADFRLGDGYDALLPVNLIVRPAALVEGVEVVRIAPSSTIPALQPGETVRLDGFVVTEIDTAQQSVTLDRPPAGGMPASCRLRLQPVPVEDLSVYHTHSQIDPISGIVTATRAGLLLEHAQRALGEQVDLGGATVRLPGGRQLPNPLAALPALSGQVRDVRVACTHGDLNLENVLVEHDARARNVHLIDFADAGPGHALRDLLRLEAEVVTRILPVALKEMQAAGWEPASVACDFYARVHATALSLSGGKDKGQGQNGETLPRLPHAALEKPFEMIAAIREAAHTCLYAPGDWTEYAQGLMFYLLGALKLKSLDHTPEAPLSKQAAFWTAAAVQQTIETPHAVPVAAAIRRRVHKPVAALIALVALVAGLGLLWALRPAGQAVAVLVGFTPQVDVRRARSDRMIPASFSMPLYRGDVVSTYAGAAACLVCDNGLVYRMPERSNLPVACADNGDPHIAGRLELDPAGALTAGALTVPDTAALLSVRGTRHPVLSDQGRVPLLLSPRRLVLGPQPVFRWTAVEGADAYTLRVQGQGGAWAWETTLDAAGAGVSGSTPFVISRTAVLELAYPAGDLVPGTTYVVTLQAHLPGVPAAREAGKTLYFELASAETVAALDATAAQVVEMGLPPDDGAYLLALLHRQQGLACDAAGQLEGLVRGAPQAPLLVQLGGAYLRTGLIFLSEANYQRALDLAQAGGDAYTQAAALAGLGQAAYARRADAEALSYLERSLAQYRELGDAAQVRAVEALVAEVRVP